MTTGLIHFSKCLWVVVVGSEGWAIAIKKQSSTTICAIAPTP
ncbi:MAG: hypothetical protein AAGD25_20130 [Cyanobacteria bacterium P01_F01_bin.150]